MIVCVFKDGKKGKKIPKRKATSTKTSAKKKKPKKEDSEEESEGSEEEGEVSVDLMKVCDILMIFCHSGI